ncbi:MAG: ATP-dependent DNA helicase RecG [Deltaproteobacteria bacterium]|nr:ATP-dependent DNA helicase RecG [Deltaproteobacteria bacterium]
MMREETSSPQSSNYLITRISPETCFRSLRDPLRFLKGVGPKRAAQLETLGLSSVEDLLYHLPFRYEDRRTIRRIREVTIGAEESVIGQLVRLEKKFIPKRRRQILLGTLTDGTGNLTLVWYHAAPYLVNGLARGQALVVHGKVERGLGSEKRIVHPDFEIVGPGDAEDKERILPIYFRPGGVPLGSMRRWLAEALAEYARFLPSFIPESIAQRKGLLDLKQSMSHVHHPPKTADLIALNRFTSAAHRSILFDEFFYLQLGLGLRRKYRSLSEGISFSETAGKLTKQMRGSLSFHLTKAQERTLAEIYCDMQSSGPMQRLVQGDVGSGKTIVAWLASVRAIENGFQAVWMAPTEILAEQHFQNLQGFAAALSVPCALLMGSLPARVKKETATRIENGEVAFVVGTHALIQEGIRIPRMGLGVIDEQHRFGVMQRRTLQRLLSENSGETALRQPDILLLSATPIPRSLAMVLYGDLEISFMDEMPPGRLPVLTRLFHEKNRAAAYEQVRQEVLKNRQAYVVYPLVEASERLQLRDATRMAEELSRGVFKEFHVGLIHGRMNSEEKERVMRRFKDGSLQILVATTVIEVGIDIPNASVILIEHAERFGLSQLHQLRGRVGRGSHSSQCLLVHYGAGSENAAQRLAVMEKEHSGFKIAEADLKLRGPGDFLGTRQSGLPDFRLANLARDSQILFNARQEAMEWLAQDPSLESAESAPLKTVLKYRWGQRLELGSIG